MRKNNGFSLFVLHFRVVEIIEFFSYTIPSVCVCAYDSSFPLIFSCISSEKRKEFLSVVYH